ncbi:hypothetical protein [Halospeciosus flavus]|uniref:hypothetical protein n=1 Tax=Halospeciosus flavus TaxID=3032283 RepID=UPI0036179C3F
MRSGLPAGPDDQLDDERGEPERAPECDEDLEPRVEREEVEHHDYGDHPDDQRAAAEHLAGVETGDERLVGRPAADVREGGPGTAESPGVDEHLPDEQPHPRREVDPQRVGLLERWGGQPDHHPESGETADDDEDESLVGALGQFAAQVREHHPEEHPQRPEQADRQTGGADVRELAGEESVGELDDQVVAEDARREDENLRAAADEVAE